MANRRAGRISSSRLSAATSTRFRPNDFARYSALSAPESSSAADAVGPLQRRVYDSRQALPLSRDASAQPWGVQIRHQVDRLHCERTPYRL